MKYELEKENDVLTIRYKLETSENWASEKWIRLISKLPKQKSDLPHQTL
ncbi:DUF4488 domain-containing protein [Capnocytophaga canimorsus]|nr:DUF4488 domain-containing protein [Capnocytophaga canimorsus]